MTFGMMSGDMWTSAEFPMFAQRGRFFPDWHSHPISISLPMQMSDSFKALLRFVFHELMGVVAFFAFIFAHTAVEWGIHFFEVTDERMIWLIRGVAYFLAAIGVLCFGFYVLFDAIRFIKGFIKNR